MSKGIPALSLVQGIMGKLPIRPARSCKPELLDQDGHDPAALAGNLGDLRRVNCWLGGTRLTLKALERLTQGMAPGEELLVLDVAAGDGDMAREMADWSRRRGFAGSITAIDIIPQILLGDNTFDVAACSLALHHMDRQGAIAMLREMGCMARRGVILNDLVRTWHGYLGTWLLSRLFTRNPLTRYDAPLSVRRAYTLAEMFALAEEAGLKPVASWTFLGYRTATAMRRNP